MNGQAIGGGRTSWVVLGIGVLAVFFGVAELVAVATGPTSAPVIGLGQAVISRTPESLKALAIRDFGEHDKTALLTGVLVVFVALAALAGMLGRRRRWIGLLGIGVLAAATALPTATQPDASALDALPSLVGAASAAAAYLALTRRQSAVASSPGSTAGPRGADTDSPGRSHPVLSRRALLLRSGSVLAAGAATYALGRDLLGRAYSAAAARAAVRLPRPSTATPEVAGTGFDIAGLPPYLTPNASFYRVDTALVVPQLVTDSYLLTVHGLVERPMTFRYDDLLALPLVERPITMVCVSDPVGGPYIGTARWLGVPLVEILRRVGVRGGADQLFMTASDGMTIGADLQAVTDGRDALLVVGMNGEPLPFEHGFPVRAVVPGIYGYASACKWLVDLELTTYAAKQAYWVQRGYAEKAPVKLESRIDTPASFAQLRAGTISVAGSAWHPTVGIRAVQVRVDGGGWHEATLAETESVDTWRLWRWEWAATPGSHTLEARAVDQRGRIQTAKETAVTPKGASGRQSVVVTVT